MPALLRALHQAQRIQETHGEGEGGGRVFLGGWGVEGCFFWGGGSEGVFGGEGGRGVFLGGGGV